MNKIRKAITKCLRERERERERKRENGEMNSKESRAGESEYETVLYGVYQYK